MPDELKRRIIELRELDWSYSQIQKATGASLGTISKVLKEKAAPREGNGQASSKEEDALTESIAHGSGAASPAEGGNA